MTTYQSIVPNITPYQAPTDVEFSAKVMGAVQGRYDKNLAEIDETLAQLGQVENSLLRPEDKEIFAQRAQEMVNLINRSGKIDWSKNNLARQVKKQMGAVLDDEYIINQIGISSKIKNFEAQMQEKQKLKDGSFSTINYQDAIESAGIDKYLKKETDSIGGLVYHDYVDITESTAKKLKSFKEVRGKESIQVPDNQGQLHTRTIESLTEAEILAYVPDVMSPEEREQLRINGRAKYRQNPEAAIASYDAYTKNVLGNIEQNIKNAEELLTVEKDEEKRAIVDTKLKAYRIEKEQVEASLKGVNSLEGDARWRYAAGQLEELDWTRKIAKVLGAKVSTSIEEDKAYTTAMKLEAEAEKARLESGAGGIDPNAIKLSAISEDLPESQNVYNNTVREFNAAKNTVISTVDSVVGNLNDDDKKNYEIRYKELQKQGLPESQAKQKAFYDSGLSEKFPAENFAINTASTERNNAASVINATKVALEDKFKENPDKYTQGFYEMVKELIMDSSFSSNLPVSSEQSSRMLKNKELIGKVKSFLKESGAKGELKDYTVNLKKYLSENPNKIEDFAKLTNELDKAFKPIGALLNWGRDVNLLEDSKDRREKIAADKGYGKVIAASSATITNEKLREKIINSIPQTSEAANMDLKQPVSFIRTADGIKVVQNRTSKIEGLFRGQKIEYEFKETDDVYNDLDKLVSLKVKEQGINAKNNPVPIKSKDFKYIQGTDEATLASNRNFFAAKTGNPNHTIAEVPSRNFLTKEDTKLQYSLSLPKIDKNKLDTLVDLMAKQTSKKFEVTLEPQGETFVLRTDLKNNDGSVKMLNRIPTGESKYGDVLVLLTQQYPQITVSAAMLTYLQKYPNEIDNLIAKLQ
jgi:hypothetical protein